MDKFRRKRYFRSILTERKKLFPYPEVFICVEYRYKLTWKEFFEFSQLARSQRTDFQEAYRTYYIESNASMIDRNQGIEIDTFKELKVDYTQYSYLKRNYAENYELLLKNLQCKLLRMNYPAYDLLSDKQKLILKNLLFAEVDRSVTYYDEWLQKEDHIERV